MTVKVFFLMIKSQQMWQVASKLDGGNNAIVFLEVPKLCVLQPLTQNCFWQIETIASDGNVRQSSLSATRSSTKWKHKQHHQHHTPMVWHFSPN